MEEYRRETVMVETLTAAIRTALTCKPYERLGQLLINVTRGEDLFNIYDEDIVAKLYAYVEDL